jgi:AraC-like DNA-binding protein
LSWSGGRWKCAWSEVYDRALAASHPAARILAECGRAADGRELLRPRGLAKALGCGVATLRRRFAHDTGASIREFRSRAKLAAAIDRLRDTDWKIEAISRDVGWRSKKDLYRAMYNLAGMSPKQVRLLSDKELEALLRRLHIPKHESALERSAPISIGKSGN